jgi:hypothetical protein
MPRGRAMYLTRACRTSRTSPAAVKPGDQLPTIVQLAAIHTVAADAAQPAIAASGAASIRLARAIER